MRPVDGTSMTMESLPELPPETADETAKRGTRGKPSVEHIVLGAVLVVVLAVGGWFLLKPGSSSSSATKAPVVPAADRPAAAALAEPGVIAKPVTSLKPGLKPMTKVAYLKAGNTICAKMNASQKALGDFPSGAKAQAVFFAKVYAITEKARKALKVLPAPTATAAKFAKLYVTVGKVDAVGKAAGKALAAGETAKAKTLEAQLVTMTGKANARFNAYGLTTCGT